MEWVSWTMAGRPSPTHPGTAGRATAPEHRRTKLCTLFEAHPPRCR